ncbi:DMT family transporter, partial [Bordetella pertussis]
GDFQFLKSGSDEPCIQPIESSQLVHLVRGAINVISATFFYLGLQALPLAENAAIAFAAPLFVTALSVLVLKERVDAARWLAVAAGFAGVLVIVRP